MDRGDFEKAASIYALMFREHAPRDVQLLFTGKPNLYNERSKIFALAFFLVYVEATERLQTLEDVSDVDASACWRVALELAGGRL